VIRRLTLIAAVLFGAAWLMAQAQATTYVGVITDTMCGAKHTMGIKPDSKCVIECVKSNPTKYKYALYDGKKIYVLSDQQTPEKFAAQKVKVTGILYEKTGVIDVKKIEPAK
jgi:hypothetical protein